MKRFLNAMILAVAATSFVAAKEKLSVVTTIFPAYDWTREVVGNGDAEITTLLDKGVDLHSYQPSLKDISKISKADVFVYVGGESDEWVEDALKNVRNKNLKVVNLMEVMGERAKAEEVKEGMQADDDDEEELDEHVWLSLRNARLLSSAIADALSAADSLNASKYRANAKSYGEKLSFLDKKYSDAVKSAKFKTLVFADRFPFRYLVDDYGLDYYAAFAGCSAETEASFKTVAFLANKADEKKLNNLFVLENSDKKIANTVNKNSKSKGRGILVLDSMQAMTSKDVKNGATYLSIMEKNLEVLRKGLN